MEIICTSSSALPSIILKYPSSLYISICNLKVNVHIDEKGYAFNNDTPKITATVKHDISHLDNK